MTMLTSDNYCKLMVVDKPLIHLKQINLGNNLLVQVSHSLRI